MSNGWKIVLIAGIIWLIYLIVTLIIQLYNTYPFAFGFILGLLTGVFVTSSGFSWFHHGK
jgi:hypothetical protein